jgi:cell division protein FtsZ
MAITSPLLDNISVEGATGVLINIVGGPDMRMREIEEAATLVQEQAHEDANIIFGTAVDENMGDMIKVTGIATGFEHVVQEIPQTLASATRPQSLSSALGMAGGAPSGQKAHSSLSAPRTQVQVPRNEEAAFPSRRAPAPPQAAAQGSTPPSAPPGRDRSTFVPPLDSEWDTS